MVWCSEQLFENLEQSEDKYFSPGHATNAVGLAPALVLTAGFDVLRDEGQAYAQNLLAAEVPTEYFCYADRFHGFVSFAGGLTQGIDAIERTSEFFRRQLG